MRKNKKIAVILALAMAFTAAGPQTIQAKEPWYADIEAEVPTCVVDSESAAYSGYLALDREVPTVTSSGNGLLRASSTDRAYMNNLAELSAKYPATRAQDYYDCWAFSAVGLAEFDMITDNQTVDKTVDYSELQLGYFTYNHEEDPLGGTFGDNISVGGGYHYLELGGDLGFVSRALLQWEGLASETTLPYSRASSSLKLSASDAYGSNVAHLQNVYCINIHTNPTAVKQEIIKHGAAGIGYYASDNGDYRYMSSCNYQGQTVPTYYCSDGSLVPNHAVNIVGWDDDFPASGFATTAPGNGAWLVRNSWVVSDGYTAGGGSYFWLSYYDKTLEDAAWIYDFEETDNYDYNYQYDGGASYCDYSNYGTEYFDFDLYANVFQVKGESNESLEAVSISLMNAVNVPYTVKVYTNLRSGSRPRSGYLAATVSGTTSYAGVYTIPLGKSVPLAKGTKFSVVVELGKANTAVDVEQTIVYVDNSYRMILSTDAYMESGQSFALRGGTWKDMDDLSGSPYYTGNWCIKAYTKSLPGSTVAQVSTLKKKTAAKTSITLKWSKVSGADGYEIYRATSKNGVYKKVATVKSGSKTTYKNTGLTKNKTYYYRVRAYKKNAVTDENGNASTTTTVGKMSSAVAIKTTKK